MKHLLFTFIFTVAFSANVLGQGNTDPVIVIHGGAGTIERSNLSKTDEAAIRNALEHALNVGYSILNNGGSALDAVEATIVALEEAPQFNAGVGAVMTQEGTHELDASIMDGQTKNAGAVAAVKTIRNPIKAARAVMEHSPHVMLTGEGAEIFAKEQKLATVNNTYFTTPAVKKRWLEMRNAKGQKAQPSRFSKFGTVGCVALDKNGNIAAGTSTGGMMNKKYGRIGDSPIIGAGTYADNSTCGVSCTGHGEFFIRTGVAKEISDQMKFGNKSLSEAVNYTLNNSLEELGGTGGIIAINKEGHFELAFNTTGMYRGYKTKDKTAVMIYKED